jgi:hypothetical protein
MDLVILERDLSFNEGFTKCYCSQDNKEIIEYERISDINSICSEWDN